MKTCFWWKHVFWWIHVFFMNMSFWVKTYFLVKACFDENVFFCETYFSGEKNFFFVKNCFFCDNVSINNLIIVSFQYSILPSFDSLPIPRAMLVDLDIPNLKLWPHHHPHPHPHHHHQSDKHSCRGRLFRDGLINTWTLQLIYWAGLGAFSVKISLDLWH